jgi:hypothetical protein
VPAVDAFLCQKMLETLSFPFWTALIVGTNLLESLMAETTLFVVHAQVRKS